jgi:hypothetical protein
MIIKGIANPKTPFKGDGTPSFTVAAKKLNHFSSVNHQIPFIND